MKNFKINSTYSINLRKLFNSINSPLRIIDENNKQTFFGYIIRKTTIYESEFYELISPFDKRILCKNAEECIIIDKQVDAYSLTCIDKDFAYGKFQLMQNELDISIFDISPIESNSQEDTIVFSNTPCIACNNCLHHSISGCQNMILKNEYISAIDTEKDFILNGEFCKYFIERT